MTQAPWPNIQIYSDTTQTIKVKVGDEFGFGFDTASPLGLSWKEQHDGSMLALLDVEGISIKPQYPSNQNTWFLFKALKPGKTRITFTYSHGGAGAPVNDQKTFDIDIE
jgi:predicted secreted protein